jgi:hypothetical protein
MISCWIVWERVVRDTSLSHAEKSCSCSSSKYMQDWLGVKHVYLQHHHCQGCEGDPCCEWKDLWPDCSPDVVGELYRLITLSSQQEQKSGEQSKLQWIIASCIAKVMNGAMFDQWQHDRMSFIWYLVRMVLSRNFLQCTTAHFIAMDCTMCCNKTCSCIFFFFFEKLPTCFGRSK